MLQLLLHIPCLTTQVKCDAAHIGGTSYPSMVGAGGAQAACDADGDCAAVQDLDCDGSGFILCTAGMRLEVLVSLPPTTTLPAL